MTPADGGAAGVSRFEVLYNEGSDSVVIADVQTHDDIAEVFHCERHTVTQTIEQALETARLFANADLLLGALKQLAHEAELADAIGYGWEAAREKARKVIAGVEGAACPSSPDGRHQVDTSMESGPNNCFHCEVSMAVQP